MPSQPLVSIVMPVLNPHPRHFPEAVASVLNQSYAPWELVIVEDPSEQSAAALLATADDARIRHVINPRRTSFAEQLNLGLALSRGSLVARMDADDVCEPHRLATQVAYLTEHPEIDLIGSNLTIIDDNGHSLGRRRYPASHSAIARALPRYNPLAHPAVMFRKGVVVDAGGYQGDMCISDYDLWNRLYVGGVRMANLQQPLLRYRVHPAGMKSAQLREMIRATLAVKRQYWSGCWDLRSRVRMLLERALLVLPAPLVLRLFLATQMR